MMEEKPYKSIDHPSDIGLEFYGDDLKSLFENAGIGMFWLMIEDIESLEAVKKSKIVLDIEDTESLEETLIIWLEKLLYDFEVKNIAYKKIKIDKMPIQGKKRRLEATGYATDNYRDMINIGIKAPTYHGLCIKRVKGKKGFMGRVVFDV